MIEGFLQQINNKIDALERSIGAIQYGGDGNDGAKTVSSSENLASGIYNYTSLTINASQALGLSDSGNGCLALLVQGNVTLGDNASITVDGKGASGASVDTADGIQGGYPYGSASQSAVTTCLGGSGGGGGGGGKGTSGNGRTGSDGGGAGGDGGAGGAGSSDTGVPGTTGSNGTAIEAWKELSLRFGNKDTLFESFGAGGGCGGNGSSGGGPAGAAGGKGGGFLYIECTTLTLGTGASISADGAVGNNGSNPASAEGASGGGGGGGGGVVVIKCKSFSGTSSQVTADGGNGGSGGVNTGSGGDGGDGGNGADGLVIVAEV